MRRLDYFLAGLGGALMVAIFYLLSPAVLEAVQYPAVRLTDNSGNYVGSAGNPIAVSGGGGTVPALQYTVNDRGTTTTPSCDFSLGYICRWSSSVAATVTASNIPGSPTNPVIVRTVFASTQVNLVTNFPATFFAFATSNQQWSASPILHAQTRAGALTANDDWSWSCDGTNCFLTTRVGDGDFSALTVGGPATLAGTSDNIFNGGALQFSGGTIPTVTCSGGSTGTSVTAGSTNNRGSFVSSSTASTTCTLTFSASGVWNQAPFCYFFDAGASITPTAYSAPAICASVGACIVSFASATSKTIGYMCF